jgi:hypothetical protein
VERSRTDPTVLLVTYSYDHNHPWPTPKGGGCHANKSSPRLAEPKPEPGTPADSSQQEPAEQETSEPVVPKQETSDPVVPKQEQEDQEEEQEQKPDVVSLAAEPAAITASVTSVEDEEESFDFGWFDQYPAWHRTASLYVPAFDSAPPLLPPEEWERELQGEDTLFAGLGELPECAIVFGRRPEIALAATAPCS